MNATTALPSFLAASARTEKTVTVLEDAAALSRLAPAWDELAANAVEPNPFYESWMLLPALEARGSAGFACAAVWSSGELVGLFPFERTRAFKGLPVRTLRSWRHESFLLCTPLVRKSAEKECLARLMGWAARRGGAALEFRFVPAAGEFSHAVAAILRERHGTAIPTDAFTRAFLTKTPDADEYLRSALSGASRKALRRKERRLQELGARYVAMGPGGDAAAWIDAFLELEASGWKGRAGSALTSSAANRGFARASLQAAAGRGRLQMVGLDIGGQPVARCVNLIAGEGSYAYRTAYDERFAQHSPGVLAEVESIRAFHALPGVEWMDSVTDPHNGTMNRLWKERRLMQSMLVGCGAWGELCVATLPLARWARRRLADARQVKVFSKAGIA